MMNFPVNNNYTETNSNDEPVNNNYTVKFRQISDEDARLDWPLSNDEHTETISPVNNNYTVKFRQISDEDARLDFTATTYCNR
jgi:hypothetical protein